MKVGDLVRLVGHKGDLGVVVRTYEHKLWNVDERGKKVNFDLCPYEPFVEVLFGTSKRGLPVWQVEVVGE